MSPLVYQLLHIVGAFLYVACVFTAFTSPSESAKKRLHMLMGIIGLIVLVAGFGLVAKFGYGFPGWVMLKLGCWLGLSVTAVVALRNPAKVGQMRILAALLVAAAVYAVYVKPF